jgi:hypothetical protein
VSDSIVMKRSCERCPAVQEIPVSVEDIASGKFKPQAKDGTPKYEIKVEGKPVASFRYLCEACESTVRAALDNISKTLEKKAALRKK